MSNDTETVRIAGDAVRRLRLSMTDTQAEFSNKVGISRPYLSQIETGRVTHVSRTIAARFAALVRAPGGTRSPYRGERYRGEPR